MSDLAALREVADHVSPPAFEDLVAVARRRRRRSALGATAGVAALALVVAVVLGVLLSRDDLSLVPAGEQSPTRTGASALEWTPERIRELGSPGDVVPPTASGLTWRRYAVCDSPPCPPYTSEPDTHAALEVTQNGRTALFEVRGGAEQAFVTAFDDDSVLVQDQDATDAPRRTRLLQADGTAVDLRTIGDPAPPVPGPDVVLIPRFALLPAFERPYLVDAQARTLRAVDSGLRNDGPDPVDRFWGPNVNEFLWGVDMQCQAFWAADGTFVGQRLDCAGGDPRTSLPVDDFPPGWLRPGRMAVVEEGAPSTPNVLHVSLDRGITWLRFPITDGQSVTSVLQDLG
jgi:hypothetical protein